MMNNDLTGKINHSQKASPRTVQSLEDTKYMKSYNRATIKYPHLVATLSVNSCTTQTSANVSSSHTSATTSPKKHTVGDAFILYSTAFREEHGCNLWRIHPTGTREFRIHLRNVSLQWDLQTVYTGTCSTLLYIPCLD